MMNRRAVWFLSGNIFLFLMFISSFANSTYAADLTVPPETYNPIIEGSDEHPVDELTTDQAQCLVPCDQIVNGGPGKDGIPSIDYPNFIGVTDDGAPADDEVVIGVFIEGQARAYPYNVLNWHEIVNDNVDGKHFSVTYCPLTGSGVLYRTNILEDSTLGVSGKLYENNLIFYDRVSDSYFSQMLSTGISGEQIGNQLPISEAIETTWRAWKAMYPDTVVLSEETGHSRDYNRYPYGNYYTDQSILFPTTYNPDVAPYSLYHPKALTQVIIRNNEAILFAFEEMKFNPVINYEFQAEKFVNIFDDNDRLALTYDRVLEDGTELTFQLAKNDGLDTTLTFGLPVFEDNSGSIWNVKGEAIAGTHEGKQLILIPTFNAFWFAASSFYYDALIYRSDGTTESFSVSPEVQEVSLDFPAISLSIIAFISMAVLAPMIRKKMQ